VVAVVTRTLDAALSVAPVLLVPLAWTFAALAAHTDVVSTTALTVALAVMAVLFAVFAAHPEMRGPALGAWRRVIAVGLAATLAGLADLFVGGGTPTHLAVVVVWLAAPVYGLVATGRALALPDRRYDAFAACSFAGAVLVVAGAVPGAPAGVGLAGLAVGAAGQTASAVDAVARR
jgi:hypothetical protein